MSGRNVGSFKIKLGDEAIMWKKMIFALLEKIEDENLMRIIYIYIRAKIDNR